MQPHNYMVMTAVGPDRKGLVNAITREIHAVGANLEDSRMAILGGEFALLLLVAGPQAALEQLRSKIGDMESSLGLSIMSKWTERSAPNAPFLPYQLKVTGFDRPGIVHQVSELLTRLGINVASLDSRLSFAPLSGTPMFVLDARLQVPDPSTLRQLKQELSATCDEVDLDFSIEAVG